MVSASFAPLLAVVLTTLAGASALTAANVGLVVAMALLTIRVARGDGFPGVPGRVGCRNTERL